MKRWLAKVIGLGLATTALFASAPIGFAAPVDCTKIITSAAIKHHKEQFTEGTQLGKPVARGEPVKLPSGSQAKLSVDLFVVKVEDDANVEDWIVLVETSQKCRIRGVIHASE